MRGRMDDAHQNDLEEMFAVGAVGSSGAPPGHHRGHRDCTENSR